MKFYKNRTVWTVINHRNRCFLRFYEQCEHSKTNFFLFIFEKKQSNVNGSWISTKTDKFGKEQCQRCCIFFFSLFFLIFSSILTVSWLSSNLIGITLGAESFAGRKFREKKNREIGGINFREWRFPPPNFATKTSPAKVSAPKVI